MADQSSCPVAIEAKPKPGQAIDIDQSGVGTSTDPICIDVGVNVSDDPGNAIQIGTDGGLFISECDISSCVDGLKNAPTGEAIPINGSDIACLGLEYSNGDPVPFDSSTGIWTLPHITPRPLSSNAAILNCRQDVYYDNVFGTGQLYTRAPFRGGGFSQESNVNHQGTNYNVGDVYQGLLYQLTNTDTCGRAWQVKVDYEWCGYEVTLESGDAIVMNHQIVPITPTPTFETVCTSRGSLNDVEPFNTEVVETLYGTRLGQYHTTRLETVLPGDTFWFGVRYQVALKFGNPAVANVAPTYAPFPVGSTRITVCWTH